MNPLPLGRGGYQYGNSIYSSRLKATIEVAFLFLLRLRLFRFVMLIETETETETETGNKDPGAKNDVAVNHRRIVSYVRREGRLTKGQNNALNEQWPTFGIEYQEDGKLDFSKIFGNDHPVVFEIGFGMGKSLIEMALADPNTNYLGAEVHRPGVGACLMGIRDHNLTNIRVFNHDSVEILKHMIPANSLSRIQIFFPDPWHKKKHHKRRIIQPEFLEMIAPLLVKGGIVHMATDWQNYAEHMRDVGNACDLFKNMSSNGDYIPRPDSRPVTKFEERGLRLGHEIWDLMFQKL